MEDYLKIIYKLSETKGKVTTNAISERLGISQASVTGMLKKLSELKLIRYTPYYGVELSQAGKKIALEVIRHHRLLELYLAEALGFTWDKVHEEAERLEHVISEEFEEKMAEFLGHPSTDPHGAPIPSKDGAIEKRSLIPLSKIEAGNRVEIKQVSDRDPEMLRYLGKIGIYPEVVIDVLEKVPFGGSLLVQVGKNKHYLGEGLTNNIFVEPIKSN
ncbi:MAG: metal-dependent transcriptional regulator [Calditrichaeota bacterium]|nr:MAG: metal-dependent transcriptional regulator [Calditrichota bacterium]